MRKLKESLRERVKVLENRWNGLPLKKQQLYIRLLFIAYALLTVFVLLFDCSVEAAPKQKATIEHIKIPKVPGGKSPALLQDTVSILIKNKIYERI